MLVCWKQFELVAAEWKLMCCLGVMIVADERSLMQFGQLRPPSVSFDVCSAGFHEVIVSRDSCGC